MSTIMKKEFHFDKTAHKWSWALKLLLSGWIILWWLLAVALMNFTTHMILTNGCYRSCVIMTLITAHAYCVIMRFDNSWDLRIPEIWEFLRFENSWDLRIPEIWELLRFENSWVMVLMSHEWLFSWVPFHKEYLTYCFRQL